MGRLEPRTWLEETLGGLSAAVERDEELHLRVRLRDGQVLEGELVEASPHALTIIRADAGRREPIRGTDIGALWVERPRPWRRFLAALGVIGGSTGALVGYSLLPWVDSADTDFGAVLVVVLLAGAGLWAVMAGKLGLRRWLAPFDLRFERDDA